jgi:hypothetical protein
MRRYLLVAAVTATVALTGLASAGSALAATAASGKQAAPGRQLWVARLPGNGHILCRSKIGSAL